MPVLQRHLSTILKSSITAAVLVGTLLLSGQHSSTKNCVVFSSLTVPIIISCSETVCERGKKFSFKYYIISQSDEIYWLKKSGPKERLTVPSFLRSIFWNFASSSGVCISHGGRKEQNRRQSGQCFKGIDSISVSHQKTCKVGGKEGGAKEEVSSCKSGFAQETTCGLSSLTFLRILYMMVRILGYFCHEISSGVKMP